MLPSDLITPKQAARILQVHASTILRWILSGKLKAWKVAGERYKISRADLDKLVEPVKPAEEEELPRTESQREKDAQAAIERMRRRGRGGKS